MKYYIAVKKECGRCMFVGEDLQDMLLTGGKKRVHIEKSKRVYIVAYVHLGDITVLQSVRKKCSERIYKTVNQSHPCGKEWGVRRQKETSVHFGPTLLLSLYMVCVFFHFFKKHMHGSGCMCTF